jgi:hypothetical protein
MLVVFSWLPSLLLAPGWEWQEDAHSPWYKDKRNFELCAGGPISPEAWSCCEVHQEEWQHQAIRERGWNVPGVLLP